MTFTKFLFTNTRKEVSKVMDILARSGVHGLREDQMKYFYRLINTDFLDSDSVLFDDKIVKLDSCDSAENKFNATMFRSVRYWGPFVDDPEFGNL